MNSCPLYAHGPKHTRQNYRRTTLGNFGDVKPAGGDVGELRIDYGPGYRVYFCKRGEFVVLLLAGGTKKTQEADIAKAKKLAQEWEESA
jgi:putative addiction module killer protein